MRSWFSAVKRSLSVPRRQIPSGTFQPGDLIQTASMADTHSVGGVSRLEVETGPDFDCILSRSKKRFIPEVLWLERLSKQPAQRFQFLEQ